MAEYAFETVWHLDVPIDRVWDAIYDADRWPQWWPGVRESALIEPGDERGVGAVRRYVWRSRLPYTLAFEMRTALVEPPHRLEGEAIGELEGSGRWELAEEGAGTVVRYCWNVRTRPLWMNLLAPLARPAFAWNHDAVMRQGGEGLARLLGARLLRAEARATSRLPARAALAPMGLLAGAALLVYLLLARRPGGLRRPPAR